MKVKNPFQLSSDQQRAVRYGEGPLLIVAGAGTGKTRVLTERIRYLISEKGVPPKNILALTFTEKAASEMLSRVEEVMPLSYEEPWISTFHAFADRILKDEAFEIGLDPSYKILSEPEQWILLRQHLFEANLNYYRPLGNPTKFISALLRVFSKAKDQYVLPSEFTKYTENLNPEDEAEEEEKSKLREIAGLYVFNQQLLQKDNALDFGDLILWVIKLFKERKSVLKKYQNMFQHLLVDEFQDTNYAQYQLIKLLCPPELKPNFVAVGDDYQAIYKWRGASISNLLGFKEDYPKAEIIVLKNNYRSTQTILNSASNLIRQNKDRLDLRLKIDKSLQSARKGRLETDERKIEELVATSGEDEAEMTAEKIRLIIKNGQYQYADIAVLGRANNHLDNFVSTFKRELLPYSLAGNRGLFDQTEIRYLISFIKFSSNQKDSASLYYLLSQEWSGFEQKLLLEKVMNCRRNKTSLWEEVSGKSDIIENLKEREKEIGRIDVSQIVYRFVRDSKLVEQILTQETQENYLKIKNLNLFLGRIKNFEKEVPRSDIFEFTDYLTALIDAGENPAQAEIEDIDTVKLMTVHSAKGLEFPVVFLVNLVNDRFPTRERKDPLPFPDELIKEKLPTGDAHLEEERRLFYVGVTRAKDILYLTRAKSYGGTKEKKPSVFIAELGEIESYEKTNPLKGKQLSFHEILPQKSAVIKPQTQDFEKISYSQIETFETCPLKYKYKYIIGVPGAPSHALSFGQTIHRTLKNFHRLEQAGLTDQMTEKKLLEIFENEWLTEGYESYEHREERRTTGKKILIEYHQKYQSLLGKPERLEQRFYLKIGKITLIGAIDRIDRLPSGRIEVVDYKTGGGEYKAKEIDKDKQLTIYALAARDFLKEEAEQLSLYFIEKNEKVSTRRTNEQLEIQKAEIIETVSEIQKSEFKPKAGFHCQFCEYNTICPAYKIGSVY